MLPHLGAHEHEKVFVLAGRQDRLDEEALGAKGLVVLQDVFAFVIELHNAVSSLYGVLAFKYYCVPVTKGDYLQF